MEIKNERKVLLQETQLFSLGYVFKGNKYIGILDYFGFYNDRGSFGEALIRVLQSDPKVVSQVRRLTLRIVLQCTTTFFVHCLMMHKNAAVSFI